MTLTLDIATTMGWAVVDTDCGTVVASGVWSFPRKQTKTIQESPHARLLKFQRKLSALCEQWPLINRLVWEEIEFVSYMMAHATHHQLLAVALLHAEEHGWRCQGVPVSVHKKHTTGKGTATKEATIFAVARRFGLRPVDDNHADALSLAGCVLDGVDLREPERKAASKLEKKAVKARRKTREERALAQREASKLTNIL